MAVRVCEYYYNVNGHFVLTVHANLLQNIRELLRVILNAITL